MAFDSQHRVWTPLFNFNGQRNSVPFPLTPAAPSTALAAVGVQVTWPNAHVYRYRVYRDGALIATLAGQSYNDTAVLSGTHDYTISSGLADQVTWSPQSPASTISLSSGNLVFNQPPSYSLSFGTNSLDLSQYVSGGNASKWYVRMSGSLPKDISLNPTTGAVGTEFFELGTFTPLISVTDTVAEALSDDWTARLTGAGVQWGHDFQSADEVDRFTSLVQDAQNQWVPQLDEYGVPCARRITTDGITGACLEIYTPYQQHTNMSWCRPFLALPGDIGYVNDGTWKTAGLPVNWKSTDRGWFSRGVYAHRDYWADQAGAGQDGITYVGDEFYLQFRVKLSASTFANNNPSAAKLAFVDMASGGNGGLVLQVPSFTYSRAFWMYTSYGHSDNSDLASEQRDPAAQYNHLPQGNANPGGDMAGCTYENQYLGCWLWPLEEWVTVLLHVVPGHQNGDQNNSYIHLPNRRRDTGLEVWVARYGATSYTKIWQKMDYVWNWYGSGASPKINGFNVFSPSAYANGAKANAAAHYRRFAQVIFSKQWIPCPQVYA